MDPNDYEEMIAKKQKERDRIVRRIERDQKNLADLDRDLDAFARVWKMMLDDGVVSGDQPGEIKTFAAARERARARQNGSISLVDAIRTIVADYDDDVLFTSAEIGSALSRHFPEISASAHKSSIPTTLSNLVQSQEIDLLERGAGRRHSIYGKVRQGQVQDEEESQDDSQTPEDTSW